MRKLLTALFVTGSLGAAGALPALADVSPTQQLPVAACNQGTMNAHENAVPETTGNGKTTPGHEAIPGTENITPCGHGG